MARNDPSSTNINSTSGRQKILGMEKADMKRIWQYSASLLFSALLAHQAFAQGYGPRSWKHYLPQTPTPTAMAPETEEAAASEPTPAAKPVAQATADATPTRAARAAMVAKPAQEASKVAVTADDKAKNKTASYYDQAEQSEVPPPAPGLLNQGQPQPPGDSPSDKTPFVDDPVTPLGGQSGNSCTKPVGCCDAASTCGTGNSCGSMCDPCGAGCGDGCCESAVVRNFARIEYLMWWGRGRSLPPLVTTSFNGTPMADAGVLPNATVLYGNNDIGNDWRSGLRLTLSRALDKDGEWMAVGRFYGLNDSDDEFHATSVAGDPILARPFFNTQLMQEDALLVGFPGVSENGSIDIFSKSDMLAAEVYVRHLILGEEDMTIDVLGGYQFTRLDDSLEINNSSLVLFDPQGIFDPNTTIAMRDVFRTRNQFHGGVVGLAIDSYRGPFKLEFLGKVGFGNMRQTVTIDGNTLITPAMGPALNDPNGLLARQTNIGTYQRDVFTILPEANFTLGYQLHNWNFSVGYSFLYYKDVAWAGSQIDRSVNLSNPPVGDPRPGFNFRNTDFWLQGLSFGAELSF